MSALQRIVLVAAILAIMTAVTVEASIKCFTGPACTGDWISVSCIYGVRTCVVNARCIRKFETMLTCKVRVLVLRTQLYAGT